MISAMWTLPNLLTSLRLLAVPLLGALLVSAEVDGNVPPAALLLFVAASLTDLADGWLARRWNQCTAFGALVDPIADKALVATALICLSHLRVVPWWATVVILGREAGVTVLRLGILRYGVMPASRGGKVKTVLQMTMIVLALAEPHWTAALSIAVFASVVWTVVTGLDYVAKAAALTRTGASAGLRPPVLVDDASVFRQQGGGGGIARTASWRSQTACLQIFTTIR